VKDVRYPRLVEDRQTISLDLYLGKATPLGRSRKGF